MHFGHGLFGTVEQQIHHGNAMLALGLFTCVSALLRGTLLLSAFHHLRRDGYFANQNGFGHCALWALCCGYFIVHGGGPYSLDAAHGFNP